MNNRGVGITPNGGFWSKSIVSRTSGHGNLMGKNRTTGTRRAAVKIRPEAVQLAKLLIAKPGYPSPEVVAKLSAALVRRFGERKRGE